MRGGGLGYKLRRTPDINRVAENLNADSPEFSRGTQFGGLGDRIGRKGRRIDGIIRRICLPSLWYNTVTAAL